MSGPRLPAYAKRLLNARRMGQHPLCVHFIFGQEWRRLVSCGWLSIPHPEFSICLKPADYVPGQFDFHVVTGLRVVVADQDGKAGEYRDGINPAMIEQGTFYDLIGELSQFAASVELDTPAWSGELRYSADFLAFLSRDTLRRGDAAQNHGWPRWWSEQIERTHGERYQTWLQCVGQEVEARLTA